MSNRDAYRFPPQGLPKPEKEPDNCDDMRRAMDKARFDDPVIRAAHLIADNRGMSGEDRYVVMAYHALRRVHDLEALNRRFIDCMPSASFPLNGGGSPPSRSGSQT